MDFLNNIQRIQIILKIGKFNYNKNARYHVELKAKPLNWKVICNIVDKRLISKNI